MTKKTSKILSLFLSLVMMFSLCAVVSTTASAVEIEGSWYYTVENNQATITAYSGSDTQLTIPSMLGSHPVTSISGLCNSVQKKKVTSITFPKNLISISSSVCNDYSALQQVTFNEGLTTIGASAFANCKSLRGVSLPSSVTTIGDYAFQNCTSLTSANINCKAKAIPTGCFSGCTLLGNVTLPTNLATIENNAFLDCRTLSAIVLPHSITAIKDNAFSNCASLNGTLVIPENIKEIGTFAFSGCSGISKVVVPNKTKTIKPGAFNGCTSLTTAYIGDSVSKVQDGAFAGCDNLEKVIFGGSYINLNDTFDKINTPVVYYAAANIDSWKTYVAGDKKSYNAPTAVSISGNKALTVNDSLQLKISVTPNLSYLGTPYYIKSSNPNVATVDQNGKVTAKSGGSTEITVTTINSVSKSVTIKVNPKAVTNVKAEPLTTSSVNITWREADGVSGYYVYRSTTKSSGYKKIGTALTNTYTDKGLTKGKTYYYKVKAYAVNSGTTFQSASSSYASVKVSAPTPSSISAKKSKSGVAKITWGKSIGAQGYEVAMATSKNGTYKSIKTVTNGSTLSFTKSGLTMGKTYYFKVRSYITVSGKKVYSPFTKIVACKV